MAYLRIPWQVCPGASYNTVLREGESPSPSCKGIAQHPSPVTHLWASSATPVSQLLTNTTVPCGNLSNSTIWQ